MVSTVIFLCYKHTEMSDASTILLIFQFLWILK